MQRRLEIILCFFLFLIITCACESDRPTVLTNDISGITSTSSISGGNVTDDGDSDVTARGGVCWNTSGSPTTSDNNTIDGSGIGNFSSSLSGLSPNTTYFVRAYATNSIETGYGKEVDFATPQEVFTPEPEFTASQTQITVDQSVQFTDQSENDSTSWSWDFGDGATRT